MKKLLFLFVILSTYAYSASFNELEEAILEVNVERVEKLLQDKGPLTESQKMSLASLAQHVIDTLNMEKYIIKAKGEPESILLLLGATGIVCSAILITIHFTDFGYNYMRDGVKPIALSAGIFSTFIACLIRGGNYEKELQSARQKKLKDSLYIKNKVYLS